MNAYNWILPGSQVVHVSQIVPSDILPSYRVPNNHALEDIHQDTTYLHKLSENMNTI